MTNAAATAGKPSPEHKVNPGEALREELRQERRALSRDVILTALTAIGLAGGVTLDLLHVAGPSAFYLYILAYLAGGLGASYRALRSLFVEHTLDIDLLMVLAAVAAALVGEVRDGAILLFLFQLAETLEAYAMGNTKRAVVALMNLKPEEATVLVGEKMVDTPIDEVPVGALILVRPGERVPLDGELISGDTTVDQSPITGESVPVDKAPGDTLFAGTVNGFGAVRMKVSKDASHSTLARMIELVTEAQAQRSPSQRFSDWFGQRYTVLVLVGSAAALGLFLLFGMPHSDAFYKAATLLVVASPCAIVISVPAAVLSALARAARFGVLFKGGGALEEFGAARTMGFDKTGTLTEGQMKVTDVVPFGVSEPELLALTAAIESASEHPIAAAIVVAAQAEQEAPIALSASSTTAVPGHGVRATVDGRDYWAGNRALAAEEGVAIDAEVTAVLERLERLGRTSILVGSDRLLGVVALADTLRPSAAGALRSLRAAGVEKFMMLTGDHANVAAAVGEQLGLDPTEVHAGLLPEEKVELIVAERQRGPVTFVGDGVNDAAALVSASVGVAMGVAGSDAALEAADVALLADDLGKLTQAYQLARHTNTVIRQNLFFALGVMLVMVLITLFGHLPLPLGVLGHEGGTILVVLNGLRLLNYNPPELREATGAPDSALRAPTVRSSERLG